MDEVSEVKAVLGSSASQPSLDVVSSRPMTCDENGAWTEQVTSIKLTVAQSCCFPRVVLAS